MASTTSNTDLVPKEALDELKALDAQAAKVTKTLEGLLTPVSKLVNELSKTSGSFKALAESEKQLESYTKKYTEAVNEQTRIERQKAQLRTAGRPAEQRGAGSGQPQRANPPANARDP